MIVVTEIIKDHYKNTKGQRFDIKITEMHYIDNDGEEFLRIAWYEGASMLDKQMKLDKGLDVFTK